jgi:hypothetical protein
LGLEKCGSNNLSILQNQKNTKTFTKNYRNKWHSGDAEYFIDGRKVSQLEGEA